MKETRHWENKTLGNLLHEAEAVEGRDRELRA